MAKKDATDTTDKKTRHRSPNYPTVSLRDAMERVKKFYDADGKAGAAAEIAAQHIGFSKAHGQAFSVLSALKKFGLVGDAGKGRIAPTQRAIEILMLGEGDPRRKKALKEAALSPSIYAQILGEYGETGLPSDEALKQELVAYKNFNPKAVDGFVKDFRETLDFAGIIDIGVVESPSETEEVEAGMSSSTEAKGSEPHQGLPSIKPTLPTVTFPLPRGNAIEIRLRSKVSPSEFETLKQLFDLLRMSIVEEGESPEK